MQEKKQTTKEAMEKIWAFNYTHMFLYFKPNKGAALIPEGKKQADLHLYEIHTKATSLKMSKPHHQVL